MSKEKIVKERLVAEIPRDLKRLAAAKAGLKGLTLTEGVIEALQQWVSQDDEDSEKLAKLALVV